MTSNNEKKLLTKSDINRVFWRSFTVNASFNYERQMSQGAQYALSPILQKLYPDKKELGEALQRHAEFFNTTPMLCPFIFGITAAMEEENATQEDFDPNTINSVKAGLMGPLAGIGDSGFWGTLRPLAGGIACSHLRATCLHRSCSCCCSTSPTCWCATSAATGATTPA